MRITINLFLNLIFFLFAGFFLSSELPAKETGTQTTNESRRMIVRSIPSYTKTLTEDQEFFQYDYRRFDSVRHSLKVAVRQFQQTEELAKQFLQNNNNIRAGQLSHFPVWCTLYRHLPQLTGRNDAIEINSPIYVLSLLCSNEPKEAEKTAREILKKTPDDYGTLLLLGILSIYNEENFPCLEQAFLMNPAKTLWIFDWHLNTFPIQPEKRWDFAHAYFTMLMKHRKLLQDIELPPPVALRLSTGIEQKYHNPEKPFPGYEAIQSEMKLPASIIRRNLSQEKMQRRTIPESRRPASREQPDEIRFEEIP